MQSSQENLFGKLYEGDQVINHILQDGILIVGVSRSGKSTVLNWMGCKPMIGKKQCGEILYVSDSNEGAHISGRFVSEIVIPNVDVMSNKTTNVIDMAGYQDNRNHVGVIGVSYMLKGVLQKLKTVRFVLVIHQSDVRSKNSKIFASPFIGFIKMFNWSLLNKQPKYKQMILSSLTIVVTMTKRSKEDLLSTLEGAAKSISNTSLQQLYRQQIIQIISYIVKQKKIHVFPQATQDCPPEDCDFVLKQQQNWKKLDLNQLKTINNEKIIKLPFQEDFQNLSSNQQKKFTQSLKRKQQFFKQLKPIITAFVQRAQLDDNWHQQEIDYSEQFDLVQQFLKKYDVYSSKNIEGMLKQTEMTLQFDNKATKQNIQSIKLLKGIEQIYKRTSGIQQREHYETYLNFNNRLKQNMKQMFKIFKSMFTKNNKQEQIIVNLAFVIIRNFREIYMLTDIDQKQQHTNGLILNAYNYVTGIFNKDITQLKTKFFKNQLAIIKKPQNIEEYITEVNKFITQTNTTEIDLSIIQMQQIQVQIMKGQRLFKEHSYQTALKLFYEINLKLNSYFQNMKNNEEEDDDYDDDDDDDDDDYEDNNKKNEQEQQTNPAYSLIQTKRIKIYSLMGEVLLKLNQQNIALQIFQYIKFVPKAIQCFEKIIQKCESQVKKFDSLLNLANYYLKQNLRQNATYTYQRAWQECYDRQSRKKIQDKLKVMRLDKDVTETETESSKKVNFAENNQQLMDYVLSILGQFQKQQVK